MSTFTELLNKNKKLKEEIVTLKNEIKELKMKQSVEDGIAKAIDNPKPIIMKLSQEGIDLIKKKEGLRLRSYLCQAGVWTIGYGSTKYPDGFPVIEGEDCTEEQAEKFLRSDLSNRIYLFNNFLIKNRIVLAQQQFSALISFGYNLGMGRLIRSGSVYKALLKRDMLAVTKGMKKYCKIRKRRWGISYLVKSKGLVKRRQEEIDLFWS